MPNSKTRNPHAPLLLILSALLGCNAQEPALVGSNAEPLTIDKVDILLVVDDSASMADFKQEELPRLVQAFVSGSEPAFADIENVHVAVTSTNLGTGDQSWDHCEGLGDDGVFIPLQEDDLVRCEAAYPTYVSLDSGSAQLATSQTIACLPALEPMGCGFEQPLEAALKALWPADNERVAFMHGQGHGTGANAGFLRDDSLLIVVVISDEDDCSTQDARLFQTQNSLAQDDPLFAQVNTRCSLNPDLLFDRTRYLNALTQLRPDNENVLFVAIAGIPPEFVSEEAQADVDFSDTLARNAYFDGILAAPAMQEAVIESPDLASSTSIAPSCMKPNGNGARPPRRLVQLAKDFGERGVVGSLCGDDFGPVVGRIIRAAAERLD